MITLGDKGLTMSKARPIPGDPALEYFIVSFMTYKQVFNQLKAWEASMKKQFLEFLDDIITTVIENCEVEVEPYIDDDGKRKAVENIVRQDGIERKLLAVIKKHLDKVED